MVSSYDRLYFLNTSHPSDNVSLMLFASNDICQKVIFRQPKQRIAPAYSTLTQSLLEEHQEHVGSGVGEILKRYIDLHSFKRNYDLPTDNDDILNGTTKSQNHHTGLWNSSDLLSQKKKDESLNREHELDRTDDGEAVVTKLGSNAVAKGDVEYQQLEVASRKKLGSVPGKGCENGDQLGETNARTAINPVPQKYNDSTAGNMQDNGEDLPKSDPSEFDDDEPQNESKNTVVLKDVIQEDDVFFGDGAPDADIFGDCEQQQPDNECVAKGCKRSRSGHTEVGMSDKEDKMKRPSRVGKEKRNNVSSSKRSKRHSISSSVARKPTVLGVRGPGSEPFVSKKRSSLKSNRRATISYDSRASKNESLKIRKRFSLNPSKKRPGAVIDLFSDTGSYFGCEIIPSKSRKSKSGPIYQSSRKSSRMGSSHRRRSNANMSLSRKAKSGAVTKPPRKENLLTFGRLESNGRDNFMSHKKEKQLPFDERDSVTQPNVDESRRILESREIAQIVDTEETFEEDNKQDCSIITRHADQSICFTRSINQTILDVSATEKDTAVESHNEQDRSDPVDDDSFHSASCSFGSYNDEHSLGNVSMAPSTSDEQSFYDVLFGHGSTVPVQLNYHSTFSYLETPTEGSQPFHDCYYGQESSIDFESDDDESICQSFHAVYFGMDSGESCTLSEQDMTSFAFADPDQSLPFFDYIYGQEHDFTTEEKVDESNKSLSRRRNSHCIAKTVKFEPLMVIALFVGMLSRAYA